MTECWSEGALRAYLDRELAGTLGIEASSVGTMLARAEAEFERRFRARYGEHV